MSTDQNHKEDATFYDGEIVAVYCRVSTDSEDQINSLENQKTYFANFAKERGLTIYKIYYDEGLTGTSWTRRDGFNNFLKAAGLDVVKEIDRNTLKEKTSYTISKKRAPKFSKVLIKNTSRFAVLTPSTAHRPNWCATVCLSNISLHFSPMKSSTS